MRSTRVALTLTLALLAAACTGEKTPEAQQTGSEGPVIVVMWHGYTGIEAKVLKAMANDYSKEHPGVVISPFFYGNSSYALQKLETALAGGVYPDISYLYGAWGANIAQSPRLVALNDYVENDTEYDWQDFWEVERSVATVDGKIVGIPALVDNLALVYNKDLFDDAGLGYPSEDWTWDDFRDAAKALTDPAKKQFGWSIYGDASDDTTWRFMPFLWAAGGDLLSEDNSEAVFNQEPGLEALTLLGQMANEDESIYLDMGDGTSFGLFTSGHIAMMSTGPWDLASLKESGVDFGVQILPAGPSGQHATISGPDNWVVLDNGDARRSAAIDWLKWYSAPEQVMRWSLETGDLPIRQSVSDSPDYEKYLQEYPGIDVWVANEANAIKHLPQVPQYPLISEAIGNAVASVLLGAATPQEALDAAAQKVNSDLASG